MPSLLADDEMQRQWERDEGYARFCYDQENNRNRMSNGKTRGDAFKLLTRGQKMQAYCDSLKKCLPFVIFVATYAESEAEKSKRKGCWRKQKFCQLNGLCVIDFDHVDEGTPPQPLSCSEGSSYSIRDIWEAAYSKLSDEDKDRILLVYITPSGHGLKVVFTADVGVGTLIDNQLDFSAKLGLNPDESCKDATRGAFLTTKDDIIFINEEKLFTYENKDFAEKFNADYRNGNSAPTNPDFVAGKKAGQKSEKRSKVDSVQDVRKEWRGYDVQTLIDARFGDKKPCAADSNRHNESLKLASDLLVLFDGDKQTALQILKAQPWVQEIIEERNEDVEQTVNSAADNLAKREKACLNPYPSKPMQAAIEKVTGKTYQVILKAQKADAKAEGNSSEDGDIYDQLPLDKWAEELEEMAKDFPCMRELFLNVHPCKLPAILFSSAALFGTLMTRAWYHFWYEPELVRRLNYCIFIIGDPGSGKNVVEKFYKKIADPMLQSDQGLIDAVNRYKEGRTERTTSTKAQKGDALKKPVVGIRVHPARTATGEFIRHMLAAVETVQEQKLNLHMFSFDSELDNVTKNNKGGDWKDREILELKCFHNEQDGQMYGNQESITGMFNVYWNFIYTGTPYALHRKVNQRNFGTGMSTRLAVIPMPDKGLAQRNQEVDPNANETIKTWAYRLDRVEGEIPIEPLNDVTYDWQSSRLEIADFNGDKADKTLLKRVPYYGIGVSLPFILMRHWDEWQEKKTLTMDELDKRLCCLAMEIQYRCQQFFFGEMAFNYFADQNKEFIVRRRTSRYDLCFRKLPEEFKTQQFMECFGCSQSAASRGINRLKADGAIESKSYGVYRKVLMELP